MNDHYTVARDEDNDPVERIALAFPRCLNGATDALFADSTHATAWGLTGMAAYRPIMARLVQLPSFSAWIGAAASRPGNLLFSIEPSVRKVSIKIEQEAEGTVLPEGLAADILTLYGDSLSWGGRLLPGGGHLADPRAQSPGPHFGCNLLLGNRIGFPNPLLTTPKSVVDSWGRGSFRSHAGTQILATRWDLRQEENGFPANRQFYLTERGRQVFYSADTEVSSVECEHQRDLTTIRYSTSDGLKVERRILLAPQEPGLPLACELQEIAVTNEGRERRDLRVVSTGMFGPAKPGALMEDVLYSAIIMQAGALRDEEGSIVALSPDYCPAQDRLDRRFHTLAVHAGGDRYLAREYGTDLNRFLGGGTLERPRGIAALDNTLCRRGPGFFALAAPLAVDPGETCVLVTLTGAVSAAAGVPPGDDDLRQEIRAALERFGSPSGVRQAIESKERFHREFASFLQLRDGEPAMADYVNVNLPFQVLYQTFVSRSFCQTQKGYREIGFREVQDLFASMPYFLASRRLGLVEDLIGRWAAQVHEFGFANHNFYWVGKEPGLWSDDALWLAQAVVRYIDLTGNLEFLDREFAVADGHGARPLYETLRAIIRYSGEISIGAHGLPLLDRADWNDCLRIDRDTLSGPAKETLYRQSGTREGFAGFSESVMNAFLLKVAADGLARLAAGRDDEATKAWCEGLSSRMESQCQEFAWKGGYFCRLLVNRPGEHSYVGAAGDNLSADGTEGSYFLNSFSWAVLSDTAREDQIESMLETVEARLKTAWGYRLVSSIDLRRVEPTVASAEYFPGDRENGAVFKHACMMAAMALFEAAGSIARRDLARRLVEAGWWMIDRVLPFRTMGDPFHMEGNPRFCTQYVNSETGQHIGPLLSGTAPWLTLVLLRAWGVVLSSDSLNLDPLLRESDTAISLDLRIGTGVWRLRYAKPRGFFRAKDKPPRVFLDGEERPGLCFAPSALPGDHEVSVRWEA